MKRLVVLVLVGVIAACGGSSSGGAGQSPAPAAGPSEADLKLAVFAYSDAFLGGHGDRAYDMLSRRCQAENDATRFGNLVRGAQILYGDETIKTLTVDSFSATTATVTYLYGNRNIDQHNQRWTVEGGQWRWDGC